MTARKFTSKIKKIVSNPWLLWPYLGGKGMLNWVPDSIYLKGCFRAKMGYPLDLKNPQTFNEKIQWLKLHDRKPEYTQMVDKYAVREYIAKTIGEEYLIPLLGVWDRFDDIDFDQLPDQFVLKCNHDSGTVVICKDKKTFDIDAASKKINARINYNYYNVWREWPYKDVKHRIIAEKYMSQMGCDDLVDYKIMCFNGKAKCEFICTNRRSETGLNVTFFDLDWQRLPFERPHHPVDQNEINKPNQLSKMISLAETLAVALDTIFVRIDFYEVNNQLYFGEFTLYPASGLEGFTSFQWDNKLGDWIQLPK